MRLHSPLALIAGLLSAAAVPVDAFTLKPDPDPRTLARTEDVDVNLGASPEAFVTSLWIQLTGTAPDAGFVAAHAALLGTIQAPRRIDLALLLAEKAGVSPRWSHSDPWLEQPALEPAPERTVRREVGAVMMFFFSSPKGPNGGRGWSNNHAPGMFEPTPFLVLENEDTAEWDSFQRGYFHPQNPGFWRRELEDAAHAGLEFLLLNVYGPDLDRTTTYALTVALRQLRKDHQERTVRLGLFDDTWTWGKPYFGPFWETLPDCADVDRTAVLLYEAKWRPFFRLLPRDWWYTVDGRPFVALYNSNTLQNREKLDAVLVRMRALFLKDFGVEPHIVIDSAFDLTDSVRRVSDGGFRWFTLDNPTLRSDSEWGSRAFSHAMVRWDSTNRDAGRKEARAEPGERLIKDDGVLKRVLNETRDTDILLLATWNDLGEGTGVSRCVDYYWGGQWRRPDHFMQLIRRSQAGETLE